MRQPNRPETLSERQRDSRTGADEAAKPDEAPKPDAAPGPGADVSPESAQPRGGLLVRLFPDLSAWPAADRRAVLREARERAWRSYAPLAAAFAFVLLGGGWIAAWLFGLPQDRWLFWAALAVGLAVQLVHYAETRARLRAMRER